MMMLGAALFWGLYTALNRPVLREVSPVGLSFFSLLSGLPVLWLIGIPYFRGFEFAAVAGWVWLAILFSGALSTGIAVALWNRAIREVGPSQTAAYNNLVPFVALLFSFLIISEPVTLVQILGGGLIVGGLVLMRRVRSVASEVA
jgi:drug/metabolite transporter (DMT)-like permease